MTREELILWARSKGWLPDRYGHLQKTMVTDNLEHHYRLKLSKVAVRYESKSSHGWVRLRSGYYSHLSLSPEGKLLGMAR